MTQTTTHDLLSAALDYARRGWYVMPLHDVTHGACSCGKPDCDKPGKHPHITDWTNTASLDPAQIDHWWQDWPHANVGILAGERSRLAVLDVDPRNGGDLALEDLVHSYTPLPETPTVISGGKGPHYYFALDGPFGKFDPGPGLNLQADGALVVAPPSLHHSGNTYTWEASSSPDDVSLAALPDWLRALGEAKASTSVDGVDLPDTLPAVDIQTLKVSHRIKYCIAMGHDPDDPQRYPSRSEALFAVIQALMASGHDDATIASVIMDTRYSISAKVLSQKNPKNPHYWEQTKAWVAKEIARAKAKHDDHPRRNGPTGPDMTGHPPGAEGTASSTDDQQPDKKETQAAILLRLANAAILLRTNDGQLYAYAPVNGHHEVLSIGERGGGMRKWLVKRYREERDSLPNTTAVGQVVEALIAQAQFDGVPCEVYTRTAYVNDKLYLDLANDRWQVVEIDADGWRVLEKSPVYFRRTSGMLPLPTPDAEGTADDLYSMLPVDQDTNEAKVLIGWLFGTLQPDGSRAHLAAHGEQGSAKSTTTRMLRQTVDPNKAPTRSLPKEEKDLVLAASNGSIVGLENVSHLADWQSDALCCLSTGAGLGTRQLYTDADEIIFAAQRPVILNGIAEVCVRGDLLDRTLVVMLPAIDTTTRKQEKNLWRAFRENHPRVLGALLHAASTALKNRDTLQFPALPRLADFAVWVEAAAPDLGMKRGEFLTLMQTNRQEATAIELEATPLSAVV